MGRGLRSLRTREEWESATERGWQVIYCVPALRQMLSHLLPQVPFKGDTIGPIFLIKRLRLGSCGLLKITWPI